MVLELPEDLGTLAKWEVIIPLFSMVAKVWNPDSGRVGLTIVDPPIPNTEVTCRNYDWMTYYSRAERSKFPPLPNHASLVPVDLTGTIIVTQDEPPDVANPEHLQNIERVEVALLAEV